MVSRSSKSPVEVRGRYHLLLVSHWVEWQFHDTLLKRIERETIERIERLFVLSFLLRIVKQKTKKQAILLDLW